MVHGPVPMPLLRWAHWPTNAHPSIARAAGAAHAFRHILDARLYVKIVSDATAPAMEATVELLCGTLGRSRAFDGIVAWVIACAVCVTVHMSVIRIVAGDGTERIGRRGPLRNTHHAVGTD